MILDQGKSPRRKTYLIVSGRNTNNYDSTFQALYLKPPITTSDRCEDRIYIQRIN